MELTTLCDVFQENLSTLLETERSLCAVLPALLTGVSSGELRECLTCHYNDMCSRIVRLESLVRESGFLCEPLTSPSVTGLMAELCAAAAGQGNDDLRDIAILGKLCRIKQYHLAACEMTRSLADVLGFTTHSEVIFEHLGADQRIEASLTVLLEDYIDTAYESGLHTAVSLQTRSTSETSHTLHQSFSE
jgi:ferritin-like metal-binding protein YciE